jgi:YidC/Oxa1 family membrane protein insertase
MNSQMTGGGAQMEQMKWMMYLMPIIFLGVFNNYAAGLSYYYFLANVTTFGQQFAIRQFVDDEKIHKKMQETKKKPKKKSSFQKRLEDMAKQQQAKQKGK